MFKPNFNNSEFQNALRDLNDWERNAGVEMNNLFNVDPNSKEIDSLGSDYAKLYRNAQKSSGLDDEDFEDWYENQGIG